MKNGHWGLFVTILFNSGAFSKLNFTMGIFNCVEFQVLGQHGPTTQLQLLMGTTYRIRDRLAAAYQMNSFCIMDFTVTQKKVKSMPEYWQ